MDDQRARIQTTFNSFNGKNLSFLDSFYAADVVFTDPVGTVTGLPALKKYYEHAYEQVHSIQFDFREILQDGRDYMAFWVMTIAVRGLNGGRPYQVHGMSRLTFNDSGLVKFHRDYVDLGEMVYEHIPVQGFIVRKIKQALKGAK
jgi:ketosteroid isomerase-like protein